MQQTLQTKTSHMVHRRLNNTWNSSMLAVYQTNLSEESQWH